jgi:SOS response regulatory protein OraA/RecX
MENENLCYNKAITLLARKAYSIAKLREKLSKTFEFSQEQVDLTITKLIDQKYLNDKEYALALIRYHLRRGQSKLYIKNKAKFYGVQISDDDFQASIHELEIDPKAELTDKINRKREQLMAKNLPEAKIKEKIYRHFLGKGFQFEELRSIIG